MYCKKCGKLLKEGEVFCEACGEPVNGSAENVSWDLDTFPGEEKASKKSESVHFDWGTSNEFPNIFERDSEGSGSTAGKSSPVSMKIDWNFEEEMRQLNEKLGLERNMLEQATEAATDPASGIAPEPINSEMREAAEKNAEEKIDVSFETPIFESIAMTEKEDLGETKEEIVDRFYTINKKNKEFQKLLDREYEKIKSGNAIAREQEEADRQADEKFVPAKPKIEDDLEQLFAAQGLSTEVPDVPEYSRERVLQPDPEFEERLRQMKEDDEKKAVMAIEMEKEAERQAARDAEHAEHAEKEAAERAAHEAEEAEQAAVESEKRKAEEAAREATRADAEKAAAAAAQREADEKAKSEAEAEALAAAAAAEEAARETAEAAASGDHLTEMHKARDTFMDELFVDEEETPDDKEVKDDKDVKATRAIKKSEIKEAVNATKAAFEQEDETGGTENVEEEGNNEGSGTGEEDRGTAAVAASAAAAGSSDREGEDQHGASGEDQGVSESGEGKLEEGSESGEESSESGNGEDSGLRGDREDEDQDDGRGDAEEEYEEGDSGDGSDSDDWYDDRPRKKKGGKVLKVIIIILALLLAVEVAFICIKVFASGSGIAEWVENVTNQIVQFCKGIFK